MKKIIKASTIDSSLGFIEPSLYILKEKYEIQLLSTGGEKMTILCNKHKIMGHDVYMYRRLSPIQDLRSLWQIIQIFYKEKPYMVHSMSPKAGLLCMLAAWITRVPRRVHTFTGLVWPTSIGLKRKILMLTDWITCACATHVIPEGKGVMEDLQNHITSKPMKVLGYGNIKGVDMIRFSRRPEVISIANNIRQTDKFTFIFVGRIVRDKGINELIEAFHKLHDNYPQARLILVGQYEKELDPINDETIDRIENHPSIEFVGPKINDALLSYYAASDCFVFPSYREGFPNTVLEAGAMGLPSIVTDINGSREIIEDGKNGLIIPSKDVSALYEAMKKMMLDTEARNRMEENARPMIESRFEQSFVQKCLLDFYDEIM